MVPSAGRFPLVLKGFDQALMRRRLTVPALFLLALSAVVFAVAACGSSNDDAEQVLKDTFSSGKSVKSGKLDVAINFSGKGGSGSASQPVQIQLTGPFQSRGTGQVPAFDLDAALGGGAGGKSVGAVSTGTQGFVTIGEQAYVLPPTIFNRFKQSFAQSAQNGNKPKTTFSALGIEPANWLKDPKLEDDENIGGVTTKHVSAGVDVPKFLDDIEKVVKKASAQGGQSSQVPNTTFTPAQKKQIADSVKDASFDVWSGKDDKIIRKLAVSLDFDTSKNANTTALRGITSGSIDFSVTLTDLNSPQTINAPANAKPFTQLQNQIRQLLGQLQGGGSGGGGSGGGGGAGGSGGSGSGGSGGGNQAYVDCIAKAGGDIAKAQKCADLLNP
jgi:hypothetical protein